MVEPCQPFFLVKIAVTVADSGFPRGGAPTVWGRQHMILPNFPKNCMKLKESEPRGASLAPPLDPPSWLTSNNIITDKRCPPKDPFYRIGLLLFRQIFSVQFSLISCASSLPHVKPFLPHVLKITNLVAQKLTLNPNEPQKRLTSIK